MQDKGIVKIFVEVITVILALVCIYYLSFSVISQHYESEAEAYAAGDNVKYNAFMDSVSKEKPLGGWFFGFTVKECRKRIRSWSGLEGRYERRDGSFRSRHSEITRRRPSLETSFLQNPSRMRSRHRNPAKRIF